MAATSQKRFLVFFFLMFLLSCCSFLPAFRMEMDALIFPVRMLRQRILRTVRFYLYSILSPK